MERQLLLLEAPAADWKLDDDTKELGLRNVAKAREVLASARAAAHAAEKAAARGDSARGDSARGDSARGDSARGDSTRGGHHRSHAA